MLRVLLNLIVLGWAAFVLLLLPPLMFGKTAPEITHVGFFSQDVERTDYWHLDLFTGIMFKDSYSPTILVSAMDSVAYNPLNHFLSADRDRENYFVYETELATGERHFINSFPVREHSILLEGDYLFMIHYSRGSDEWTKIHLPSRRLEPFLSDTQLERVEVSPDSRWFAGLEADLNDFLFVNLLDNSSYRLENYCCAIFWSPDSQWYMTIHSYSGLTSVLSTETGEAHPLLPSPISMLYPSWTRDSQSIVFQDGQRLASVSLTTGEIHYFPVEAYSFQTSCVSPEQHYILSYENPMMNLVNLETGAWLWQQDYDFSTAPICFWSDDGRYLTVFLSTSHVDAHGNYLGYWERFIFTDTLSKQHWVFTPQNLPPTVFYLHIPD